MASDCQPSKTVVVWLWTGIVLVLAMVVIGGMTRLTNSGLSMVHWTFTGSLPPMTEVAWQAEFTRYQQSPEFREVHSHFTVQDFKGIFWWEYTHRLFGRLIGVVFLVPFVFFLWRKKIPALMLGQFLIILGLGAFQGLLGWFMVKSGLVDVPRVSHYRLAAHLSTAFITCAYILWVALGYQRSGKTPARMADVPRVLLVFGALLVLQIAFGAFVAGLRAGWIHNTWPLMDGDLVSPAVTAMEPLLVNFVEGRSGVQFVHRTLGLLVLIYALWLWLRSPLRKTETLKTPLRVVGVAVLAQVTLGVCTLLFHVPIALAVIHQVVALIILLAWVWAVHVAGFSVSTKQ